MLTENEIALDNAINDICQPKPGRFISGTTEGVSPSYDNKSEVEKILTNEKDLKIYENFKHRNFTPTESRLHRRRRDISLSENFQQFPDINDFLREMIHFENEDNGMRNCRYLFRKMDGFVSSVRARMQRGDYCMKKIGDHLVMIKKGIHGSLNSEARMITIPFKINKVDADIRNNVMSWFE